MVLSHSGSQPPRHEKGSGGREGGIGILGGCESGHGQGMMAFFVAQCH